MHALRVNFVASGVPAGGLENALPLSGWLANDGTSCGCRVLWRGSKQERHPASGVPATAFIPDRGGRRCSSLGSIRIRDRTRRR